MNIHGFCHKMTSLVRTLWQMTPVHWLTLSNKRYTLILPTKTLPNFRSIWFPSSPLTTLLTYLLTYSLTPWCRVVPEQLTGLQLVKKFPAFHGTPRFITALTSVRHLSLSWARPIQSIIPTSHLLEIHPNIIHLSTPRSPQWSLSLRFPHQDPIHPPLLTHTRHMPSQVKL